MQGGSGTRSSEATLSEGLPAATPSGRADFALWTALLVNHDATASLILRASPQTKIGSVTAGQTNVIRL